MLVLAGDRVHFLQQQLVWTMFWLFAANRAHKTDVFTTAEQCLYSVKVFSASHTNPPARELGKHPACQLGGDTTEAADPNSPKGYSIPCGGVLSI